jgi:lipopolysaccharide export system permease protein
MGLLHRHLFASVASACAVAVALFAFLLIVGHSLRDLLGYVMAGQIAPLTLLRLIGLMLPYVAVYALPIGLLTAVLLVLGRLSSQQEITAMRAAGLSLGYIARPIWLIAGAAVLLSLALNFYVMPMARTAQKTVLNAAIEQSPLKLIVPKTFVRELDGFVVYASSRDGAELRDFWLWRLDKQKRVLDVARAKSATVAFREADNHLILTMRDLSVEARGRERPEDFSKPLPIADSASWTVEMTFDGLFKKMNATPKTGWLTLNQLLARRAELRAKGADATPKERLELTRVVVALNEKAATSLGVLALAFVAVPLGIKVSRKETSANLGIAVALVVFYYFLTGLGGLLERSPTLRPELWVWAPPLAYAAAGFWMFRRVDRA